MGYNHARDESEATGRPFGTGIAPSAVGQAPRLPPETAGALSPYGHVRFSLAPDLPPAAFDEWRTQPPVKGRRRVSGNLAVRRLEEALVRPSLAGCGESWQFLGWPASSSTALVCCSTLNQEVVAALHQEQDTPTSTPLITAVVLPSGHTPPSAAGGAQFNEAEIPGAPAPAGAISGEPAGSHPRASAGHPD